MIKYSGLAAALLAAAHMAVAEDGADTTVAIGRDCGAYCVGIVDRLVGDRRDSFEDLQAAVKADDNGVCSLEGIATALEGRGYRVSSHVATESPPPGIAVVPVRSAVRGDIVHFVVVRPTSPTRVIVYDPPVWVREVPWSAYRDRVIGPVVVCQSSRGWTSIVAGWTIGVGAAVVLASLLVAAVGRRGGQT